MDQLEIIRNIPKGIIGWYDFVGVESALYIGKKEDSLYDELSVNVPRADVYDDTNGAIGKYDLILCSIAFEKYNNPSGLFNNLYKMLNEEGRLLITMNNRLGIKFFCGDRDPYTGRNFDGIEDYRRAYSNVADTFNGRCFSQNEIKEMLMNNGFGACAIKFYSVYPSIDEPTFLYEEGYVPNEDLANRIHPAYNYSESVFLDEEAIYSDLINNDLFHKMANGYLVEVVKNGRNSKVKHITNSIERGSKDALYTIIESDTVTKTAIYPEGNDRLINLDKNMTILKGRGANIVEGKLIEKNGRYSYVMPFVNAQTTQKYLKNLVDKGDKDGFIDVLEKFRNEIVRLSDSEEKNMFIDLVPLNSFYLDGRFVFFDQEFCIDECSINLLIYRMIATVYGGDNKANRIVLRDDLLRHFGVYDEREKLSKAEWDWLGSLLKKSELADYHKDRQKNYQCIGSNRQRMNYSQNDYERLFINIFDNADTRKLILFGSGNFTKHFLMIYGKDYPVYAIIDNSCEKWGQELEGIKIFSPKILNDMNPAEYKVIICIKDYISVMKQLDAMGIGGYSIYDTGRDYPRQLKPLAKVVDATDEQVKKKYHIGYVAGAFDMFHLGHLNLLRRAKEQCDYLIVGVIADDTMEKKKDKKPIIPEADRCEIVAACRYVDQAEILPEKYNDIVQAYRMFHFDVMFSGNDHATEEAWLRDKKILEDFGADIVFFDYTQKISSTKLREELAEDTNK